MSERPASASVRRFADDLRRIREARGITTADLHNETKIPESLLRSFEETGLFDHPMFNRVYLRSFVRSYSEVLGITPEIALEALDEAFESRYEGRLRWAFLGEEPPTAPVAEAAVATPPETEQPSAPVAPPVTPPRVAGVAEDRDALRRGERPVTPAPRKQVEPVEDISWAVQSPPSTPPYAASYEDERSGSAGKWIMAIVGVIAIAAVAYYLLTGPLAGRRGEPTAAAMQDTASTQDTARVVSATDADTASVNLPDTLRVVLQAIGDGVQGMRVKPDTTTRYPIWIERDSYRELRFVNRISLQNQLHDVRIKIEGRDYTPRPDTSGMVVITRQDVRRLMAGATTAQ